MTRRPLKSFTAFDAPLALETRPSRTLRAGLVALHAAAGIGLMLVPPAWGWGGNAVLVASLGWEWRRSVRRHRLTWRRDGCWDCGEAAPLSLGSSTFLSPWLVILSLHDGRRSCRWALARDALPAEQWRRLRARLRVQGAALTNGAQR